jgi:hypothetical protein
MLLVPVLAGNPCSPVGGTSVGDGTDYVEQCPILCTVPRSPSFFLLVKPSPTKLTDWNHDFRVITPATSDKELTNEHNSVSKLTTYNSIIFCFQ